MDASNKAAEARKAYAPKIGAWADAKGAAHIEARYAALYDGGRGDEFKHERNDCTVRALTLLTKMTYAEAHAFARECGRKDQCGARGVLIMEHAGGVKQNQYKRPTFAATLAALPRGFFAVFTRGHVFAVIDGKAIDTFAEGARRRVFNVIAMPDPTNGR